MRKDGKCVPQQFPQPPKSIRAEAESGANMNYSIAADKLPFEVAGEPGQIRVMSLDKTQASVQQFHGNIPESLHRAHWTLRALLLHRALIFSWSITSAQTIHRCSSMCLCKMNWCKTLPTQCSISVQVPADAEQLWSVFVAEG